MKAIRTQNSYYPFGMQMPGRVNSYGTGTSYRYAYDGMERDNEVSGNGNSYTTEFRQYDPRLGRWKSLDPLMAKYPNASPYNAFNNNPVFFIDPLGLEGEEPKDGGVKNSKTDKAGGGKWNPQGGYGKPPKEKLTSKVKDGINSLKSSFPDIAKKYENIYKDIKETINDGHSHGYTNSANALTHYMNGTGETMYFEADWVRSNTSALENTKSFLATQKAIEEAKNSLPKGESKTYQYTYATSITGFLDDFYYALGTAFIRSKITVKIKKTDKGDIEILSGYAYHSLIDQYDWHNGLGTSAGNSYFKLNDSDLNNMLDVGASEFAMRAYWTDKLIIEKNGATLFGIPIGVDNYIWKTSKNLDNYKTGLHDDEYYGISGSAGAH